jgi:hypothetical protein
MQANSLQRIQHVDKAVKYVNAACQQLIDRYGVLDKRLIPVHTHDCYLGKHNIFFS